MHSSETLPLGERGLPIQTVRVDVVEGPDKGKSFEATQDRINIGTAPTNDLVLSDATVSRYHLEILRQGPKVLVVDHGSTNGTIVHGVAIERASVPVGSVLEIGKTQLAIREGGPSTIEIHDGDHFGGLVGRSAQIRKLMAAVQRIGRSDASVLIVGETGTGKDLVAKAIHDSSPRAGEHLEIVDCGSVLPTLLASELFGHEKGAFTGAESQHVGAFERANGGTLFLDEIGELPLSLQAALLGALERRSFRRLGGKQPINVDVRLISATHRDLRSAVNSGAFRQDLYYRLAVVPLMLPPLRERREDLPLLAEHFLRKAGYAGDSSEVLTPQVLENFAKHDWPGNVRELRNVLEATIAVGDVPTLHGHGPSSGSSGAEAFAEFIGRGYNDARAELIDRFEDVYLRDLLARTDGNVSEAARQAGMNRTYLSRLLKRRGMRLKRVPEDID